MGLSRWVESWDALVSLERRRLSCIALLTLLAAGSTPSAARVVSSQHASSLVCRASNQAQKQKEQTGRHLWI